MSIDSFITEPLFRKDYGSLFWQFFGWTINGIKNAFKILKVHLMVFMSCSLDNFEHSNFRAWNWISTERGQVNKIIYKLIFESVQWKKWSKKCQEFRPGKYINFMGGIAKLSDRFCQDYSNEYFFEWKIGETIVGFLRLGFF